MRGVAKLVFGKEERETMTEAYACTPQGRVFLSDAVQKLISRPPPPSPRFDIVFGGMDERRVPPPKSQAQINKLKESTIQSELKHPAELKSH